MSNRWNIAIEEEQCMWKRASHVVNSPEGRENIIKYWSEILEMLPFKINPYHRILDIGCGPAGILLAINSGIQYGLDPLIDQYKRSYPLPNDCNWISSKIEDFKSKQHFDVIFAWNSLDHVDDIQGAATSIKRLLSKNGYLVVSIWCHTTKFFRHYFKLFNRYIDKFHPHQVTKSDILSMFADLYLVTHTILDKDSGWDEDKVLPLRTLAGNFFHLVHNPLKVLALPIKILDSTGFYPLRSPKRRSIFKLHLFIFHNPRATTA